MAAQFHRSLAAAADVAGVAAEIAVADAGAAVIRNPFDKQNGDAFVSPFLFRPFGPIVITSATMSFFGNRCFQSFPWCLHQYEGYTVYQPVNSPILLFS